NINTLQESSPTVARPEQSQHPFEKEKSKQPFPPPPNSPPKGLPVVSPIPAYLLSIPLSHLNPLLISPRNIPQPYTTLKRETARHSTRVLTQHGAWKALRLSENLPLAAGRRSAGPRCRLGVQKIPVLSARQTRSTSEEVRETTNPLASLVGVRGFEPPAPTSRT
ncbi:MAG: hypothetical protein FD153_658, partial [Rhodospirillaceae bacterium]